MRSWLVREAGAGMRAGVDVVVEQPRQDGAGDQDHLSPK